jgi:hypothetical protein
MILRLFITFIYELLFLLVFFDIDNDFLELQVITMARHNTRPLGYVRCDIAV